MSLLELVVALAITGLILTLTAQSGAALVERWENRAVARDVKNRIASLSLTAALDRKPVTLAELTAETLGLPEGWRLEEQVPLGFSASGLCSEALFSLMDPAGRRHDFEIAPPACIPRRL